MKKFGEIFSYKGTSSTDKTRFFHVEFENKIFYQAKMFSNGTIELYENGEDIMASRTLVVTYKEIFPEYQ